MWEPPSNMSTEEGKIGPKFSSFWAGLGHKIDFTFDHRKRWVAGVWKVVVAQKHHNELSLSSLRVVCGSRGWEGQSG